MLAGVSPALAMAASTASSSPPSTAVIPVGVAPQEAAMASPRTRVSAIASGAADHAGDHAGRELADAVPGRRVGLAEQPGDRDGGRDQQRLGDGGIGDLFRAARGAEPDQVSAGQFRPGAELLRETGYLKPGGQEAGGLSALPGRGEDQHVVNLAL